MHTLYHYADLISALFGLVGAFVLGWPALKAVTAKAYWEQLTRLEARASGEPENDAALHGIRRHVERGQLGDSRSAAVANLIGFGLLLLSFLFLGVASIGRLVGG